MNVQEIINLIENFAPLELQEDWDNSGWQIYLGGKDVKKILLCLSVTENIIKQAVEKKGDLIISHHPFIFPFFIPFNFNKNIPIYSAHTNLDITVGGTTDTLINLLELDREQKTKDCDKLEFPRTVDLKEGILLEDFIKLIKKKLNLETVRIVNNINQKTIKRIAFCAGSGASLAGEAKKLGADVFVTGDVKYHDALDSDVIIIDIGHFESERPVLETIQKMLEPLNLEVIIADEKSPFTNY